jgi:hypothetical protein
MADAKMLNLQRVNAKLGRLPSALKDQVAAQLKVEVDGLVEADKRACPVDEASQDSDEHLRDSIHAYENPDRDLSYRVTADAMDEKGKFIGAHVEQGHRARDGTHVAARPFFFPTYRARKKGMRSRLMSTGRKAAKQLFPG